MNTAKKEHLLSLGTYSLEDLRDLVEGRPTLSLSSEVAEKIQAGADYVQRKAMEDVYIYGVNTGFGSLCETRVLPSEVELLQYNHVVSHACGVGPVVSEEISRLTLLIKLLTFRSGHTGVSVTTVQRLLDLWNHGLIPAIPKKGTVGASGDLAPLAHLALPLLGQGQVFHDGALISGEEALGKLGYGPLRLKAKEGLALTNGVQYINAYAAEALATFGDLVAAGEVIAALSLQAYSASETFYQSLYHSTSRHRERHQVARNIQRLVEGSNHFRLPSCNNSKQDPYSFRCIPQVHGAIRQAYDFGYRVIEDEVNGVSDNPLFFPEEDRVLFGGNLHGESTAMALDFMAIAASELSSISERRTYLLLSGTRGLPDFLVGKPGVNSGFMITQYTSAALVNQNKVLASPACVDTISTCQLQEDHVSMGGTSAYKLQEILENCEYVLGIELVNAVQASELNEELELSPVTARIREEFRRHIEPLGKDRAMSEDLERARDFVREHRREWRRWLDDPSAKKVLKGD